MRKWSLFIALIAGSFCSCNNMNSQSQGAIKLGDSSMIVTEKDPKKLQDLVTDLKPEIPTTENRDTVAATQSAPAPDTVKKSGFPAAQKNTAPPQPQQQAAPQNGLLVDFNIASITIPGITAKQAGKADLSHANGAVYTWISGTVNNAQLKVTANVNRVSQRYQSVVILKTDMGILPLETLSATSGWEPLKGSGNVYKAAGLDDKSLDAPNGNKSAIRSAVEKACKRRHMSRKKIADWLDEVSSVRSTSQKPLYTTLRSVMWKLDGKDANGKTFSKQVRIDMPL